jgi:type II secretory pathway pseudopilin PulG
MYYNDPKMSRKHKKPSKVVVSGEIKQQHHSLKVKRPHISRRMLIIVLICLIVFAAAAAAYFVYNSRHKKAVKQASVSAQCSELYLNGYYTPTDKGLVVNSKRDLKPLVTKIQALPGYDTDANCLVVVVEYYINLSDAKNSKLYYDKLTTAYAAKGYVAVLKPIARTPTQLKPIVEFLQLQLEESKKNMLYGPKV